MRDKFLELFKHKLPKVETYSCNSKEVNVMISDIEGVMNNKNTRRIRQYVIGYDSTF